MTSAKEVLFSFLIDVCQQFYTETTQLNLFKRKDNPLIFDLFV